VREERVRPDLSLYLGRRVKVRIDRPLEGPHPQHPDIRYGVNYGFIPGTVSGDGQPVDAYVVGVSEPLAEFEGIVIAVVLRADDIEDKLVVAPEGIHILTPEIEALIRFQEKYFISRVAR
jgi:inorganic pyrophosphatase